MNNSDKQPTKRSKQIGETKIRNNHERKGDANKEKKHWFEF